MTATAVTTTLPSISALRRLRRPVVPDLGKFGALSYLEGKVLCRKSQGMPLEVLQASLRQIVSGDFKLWWENRRSKRTSRSPDFRHKISNGPLWLNNRHKPACLDLQLAALDAGMKTTPEYVSRQSAIERLGGHEGPVDIGMCRKLCENGRVSDAVDALNLWVQQGYHIQNNLFYIVLKTCITHNDLGLGRRIHALTIKGGYEGDAFLATHLISLYASHGRLEDAMQVFRKVPIATVHNWTTIIFAYAKHAGTGRSRRSLKVGAAQAIRLYRQMLESTSTKPDNWLYAAVLQACATAGNLLAGKEVHAHILAALGEPDSVVQAGLVNMYVKCGSLGDARRLFDRLPERHVVTWNALFAGYAQQRMGMEALNLYSRMQQEGKTAPDSVTYVCLLQSCASLGVGAVHQGKQLHAEIEIRGLQEGLILGGSLVNMYAKCGSLGDARRVFDRLRLRNVVTWNALLAGYVQQGIGQEALSLYNRMQHEESVDPDCFTYTCLLMACATVGVGALVHGKQLHAQIEEQELQEDLVLGGSLVNMYAKCGSLGDAHRVFDRLPERDVVTWNVMLAGYTQEAMGEEALSLYSSMQQEGLTPPDAFTYACLLQACAIVGVGAVEQGKQLHAEIEKRELQEDLVLGGSLVNMYAKCGSLGDARRVFDRLPERDVVTWTAMLSGYTRQGMGQDALSLYSNMRREGFHPPDSVTYVCLLQACASVGAGALNQGQQLHAEIEMQGLQVDLLLGGSLVNMYAKCGSLGDARKVFERLQERDVVTWTALIAGYMQQGMSQEALSLYYRMQQEGSTAPDAVTYVCLLHACSSVAALPLGRQLHAQIEEQGLQADVAVGAGLVNMYAKCGSMFDSQQVFDALRERSIEVWNALISGYARQGDIEVVFNLVDRMRLMGMQPNGVTAVCLLTACSHAGQVDKGRKYFEAMELDYGISPTIEHYTCMIDLLGRAGRLEQALQMAKTMPFPTNGVVWVTLLGACRLWKNVEIAQQAFEFAVTEDGQTAASLVLMSNIYASAQMWEEAKEMQARCAKLGARKKPGESWWTDMAGVVHTFVVGNKKQPDWNNKMNNSGYTSHHHPSLQS